MTSIAIDLTALDPRDESGGAKMVALSLVREMADQARDLQFVVLTEQPSHEALAFLDASNVRRVCVGRGPGALAGGAPRDVGAVVRRSVRKGLPPGVAARLKLAYWSTLASRRNSHALRAVSADLMFCPLTVPHSFAPGMPLVSVVYDLQDRSYPRFFTPEQRLLRRRQLQRLAQRADRLVCISNYVRQTVLAATHLEPERVVTIHLALLDAVDASADQEAGVVLRQMGLSRVGYLLYPANFWPHKNHATLLEALRRFRLRRPDSDLVLVCTGAPTTEMERLRQTAQALGLGDHVLFPGFLPRQQLSLLLSACRAVVFPSLYEGFGMPVLEAMARGKPVLCSRVTSLPEVAGEAAVFFDPHDPDDIAGSIERLVADPASAADLGARGLRQAARFGAAPRMAREYLELFRAVIVERHANANGDPVPPR